MNSDEITKLLHGSRCWKRSHNRRNRLHATWFVLQEVKIFELDSRKKITYSMNAYQNDIDSTIGSKMAIPSERDEIISF